MDRFYQAAKDKNVAKVIVYANDENELFYDAELTEEVPATDCLDLFVQGVIAFKEDTYYAALSCTKEGVIGFAFPVEETEEDEEEEENPDPEA